MEDGGWSAGVVEGRGVEGKHYSKNSALRSVLFEALRSSPFTIGGLA